MEFTLIGLAVLFGVAGVCGVLGNLLVGGNSKGFLASCALGLVGAFIGTFAAGQFNLPHVVSVPIEGNRFPIVWSVIGSSALVFVTGLFNRGKDKKKK